MSDQEGKGKQPPADDRTLLDPLGADELKALREAREKLKGSASEKPQSAAVLSKQIGPDAGAGTEDDIGDAPTRAIMQIPAFELKSKEPSGPPGFMAQPKPMSAENARVHTTSDSEEAAATVLSAPTPSEEDKAKARAELEALQKNRPSTGGGFGDNTLMWMSPVKPKAAEIIPERGAAAAAGMIPTEVPKDTAGRRAATYLVAVGVIAVVALLGWVFSQKTPKSPVEFVTNPNGAQVSINGKIAAVPTPMRAEIKVGVSEIEISMEGYKTEKFTLNIVEGAEAVRKTFELSPLSKPGLKTVSVEVSPVAANVTLDQTEYPSRRIVRVANIDPKKPHKITIVAGGYETVTSEIPAGQLKELYKFELKKAAAPE